MKLFTFYWILLASEHSKRVILYVLWKYREATGIDLTLILTIESIDPLNLCALPSVVRPVVHLNFCLRVFDLLRCVVRSFVFVYSLGMRVHQQNEFAPKNSSLHLSPDGQMSMLHTFLEFEWISNRNFSFQFGRIDERNVNDGGERPANNFVAWWVRFAVGKIPFILLNLNGFILCDTRSKLSTPSTDWPKEKNRQTFVPVSFVDVVIVAFRLIECKRKMSKLLYWKFL